ncbi:MAG: hypothetical protein ACD_75C01551G0002 [uncultured bacterium]|nr:MAG: hypothetical protein ACD_75C01551G0002 [uncultured bacterium]
MPAQKKWRRQIEQAADSDDAEERYDRQVGGYDRTERMVHAEFFQLFVDNTDTAAKMEQAAEQSTDVLDGDEVIGKTRFLHDKTGDQASPAQGQSSTPQQKHSERTEVEKRVGGVDGNNKWQYCQKDCGQRPQKVLGSIAVVGRDEEEGESDKNSNNDRNGSCNLWLFDRHLLVGVLLEIISGNKQSTLSYVCMQIVFRRA